MHCDLMSFPVACPARMKGVVARSAKRRAVQSDNLINHDQISRRPAPVDEWEGCRPLCRPVPRCYRKTCSTLDQKLCPKENPLQIATNGRRRRNRAPLFQAGPGRVAHDSARWLERVGTGRIRQLSTHSDIWNAHLTETAPICITPKERDKQQNLRASATPKRGAKKT